LAILAAFGVEVEAKAIKAVPGRSRLGGFALGSNSSWAFGAIAVGELGVPVWPGVVGEYWGVAGFPVGRLSGVLGDSFGTLSGGTGPCWIGL